MKIFVNTGQKNKNWFNQTRSLSHRSPWVLLLFSVYLKSCLSARLCYFCSDLWWVLPWLSSTPWRTYIPQHHCLHRIHAIASDSCVVLLDQGSAVRRAGSLNCFSAVLMKLLWNDLYLSPLLFSFSKSLWPTSESGCLGLGVCSEF